MSAIERVAAPRPVPAPPAAPVAPYGLHESPLWACADEHSLWGRLVTDPGEIAAIGARVERYSRGRGGRR